MYNLEYLPLAKSDLQKIAEYISYKLCNPNAAIRLIENIVNKADKLTDMPYSNSAYYPPKPLKFEYRRLIVDNYSVFYTVDEKSKMITVARVIYSKRNLSEHQ